ncbi:MAG: MerC domain-containing protein [Xanthomonadales bacterium]|nr:MerC domain-containing protein [Xanthomonadales bacterium]
MDKLSAPPSRLARYTDRFGATAAFLCAVHCAALPLLIGLLPALGLGFLADHGFERGFVAFASVLAASSLILGFRRHHDLRAFALLAPGVVLLVAGVATEPAGTIVHAVLVTGGGLLVALAHLANQRLSHGHIDAPDCAHGRSAADAV